jgi:hypothetical protein
MWNLFAREVITGQRRVESVGIGGGKSGSNTTREGRSLHVDRRVDVDLTQGGTRELG